MRKTLVPRVWTVLEEMEWAVVCTSAGRPHTPPPPPPGGSETHVKRVEAARAGGTGCPRFFATRCRAAPLPGWLHSHLYPSETVPKSTSLTGGEGFPGLISFQPSCAAILNSRLLRPTQRSFLLNTLFGFRASHFRFPDFIGKTSRKKSSRGDVHAGGRGN